MSNQLLRVVEDVAVLVLFEELLLAGLQVLDLNIDVHLLLVVGRAFFHALVQEGLEGAQVMDAVDQGLKHCELLLVSESFTVGLWHADCEFLVTEGPELGRQRVNREALRLEDDADELCPVVLFTRALFKVLDHGVQ